jgi:hypothetical protein
VVPLSQNETEAADVTLGTHSFPEHVEIVDETAGRFGALTLLELLQDLVVVVKVVVVVW